MATTTEESLSQREKLEKQHDRTVREEDRNLPHKGNVLPGRGDHRRRVPALPPEARHLRPAPGRRPDGALQDSRRAADRRAGGAARRASPTSSAAARATSPPGRTSSITSCRWRASPDLMHMLADVGLTNREACYNTVRNVTACPWAGIAQRRSLRRAPLRPARRLRVPAQGPHRQPAAQIQDSPSTAAPDQDCIQGAINDVGLRAVIRDGKRGFRMIDRRRPGTAARRSAAARRVRPRRAPGQPVRSRDPRLQQYGNRKNKNKARLKFVMRERGFEWLKEQIEKEYAGHPRRTAASRGRRWCRKASAAISRTRSRWATARCCPW